MHGASARGREDLFLEVARLIGPYLSYLLNAPRFARRTQYLPDSLDNSSASSLPFSHSLSVSVVRAKSARRLSGAHTRIHAQACTSSFLSFALSLSSSHVHRPTVLSHVSRSLVLFIVSSPQPRFSDDYLSYLARTRSLLGSASPSHCHELMRRAACREPLSVLAANAFPASKPTNREIRTCRGRDPINFV